MIVNATTTTLNAKDISTNFLQVNDKPVDFKDIQAQLNKAQASHAASSTCPNCGYCPHCGRGGYHTYPYYQPYYPYTNPLQPSWYVTFTTTGTNTV